jgi:protein gp37
MAESTIGWLHPPPGYKPAPAGTPGLPGYTVNFWHGCTKVDAGCKNCYAERRAGRKLLPLWREQAAKGGPVWGPNAPRHILDAKATRKLRADIRRWNREAEAATEPRFVFASSHCDVLEDEGREDVAAQRRELIAAIEESRWLRWLFLTKRPENFERLIPEWRKDGAPGHVWFGISASDQQTLDDKLDAWAAARAKFKFLSLEPLIGEIDLRRALAVPGMVWGIVGGESGARAKVRPFYLRAARRVVRQLGDAGRAAFVKQLGARVIGVPACRGCEDEMDEGDVCHVCGDVVEVALADMESGLLIEGRAPGDGKSHPEGAWQPRPGTGFVRVLHLQHEKGENPGEWPPDLRVQEWPTGASYVWGAA